MQTVTNIRNSLGRKGHCFLKSISGHTDWLRLQQPVQNPISDNTNVLWNSPSLGKNYSYRLPLVL